MSNKETARQLEEALAIVRGHLEANRAEEAAARVTDIVARLEGMTLDAADVPRVRALWRECNELAERSLGALAVQVQKAATGRRAVSRYGEER